MDLDHELAQPRPVAIVDARQHIFFRAFDVDLNGSTDSIASSRRIDESTSCTRCGAGKRDARCQSGRDSYRVRPAAPSGRDSPE